MNHLSQKKIIITILLLTAAAVSFIPGKLHLIGSPVIIGLTLLFFLAAFRKKKSALQKLEVLQPGNQAADLIPQLIQKQVNDDTSQVQISALGSAHRKQERQIIEASVDLILDTGIRLIKEQLKAHTIAVFFPTLDGGYKIRKYDSTSEHFNKDAVLYPGIGVIGGLFKDGLKQLNLPEIMSDSATLYYYHKDVGIKSLIASTIKAADVDRGTIIADSTTVKQFSDKDHQYLSLVASLIGQAVFSTYLYTEHKLTHVRLAAMSSIEKEFFGNLAVDPILDKMADVIPFAISCDRMTISLRCDEKSDATIKRAWGSESEWFQKKTISLKEKTLAGILFSKNLALCRNFSKEHYEARYSDEEPKSEEFSSFLAVPLGVDTCNGMILLESRKPDAFNDLSKDLLFRIALSAGLALEKTMLLEKTKALATRDGLTGLRNHREFQLILKDEITRSIRYNDPLALVLCDIDFFKKLNDTYGHQFGDLVLKVIASQLESSIRDGVDTAARYGGEEFVLILVKNDDRNALETTDRIRQRIANLVFKSPTGDDVRVTMSFGIALYRQHAKQIDELIKKADKALYRAKENGRNRVEVF